MTKEQQKELERFKKDMRYEIEETNSTEVSFEDYEKWQAYLNKISDNLYDVVYLEEDELVKDYISIGDELAKEIIKHFDLNKRYYDNGNEYYYDAYPCTDVVIFEGCYAAGYYVSKKYYEKYHNSKLLNKDITNSIDAFDEWFFLTEKCLKGNNFNAIKGYPLDYIKEDLEFTKLVLEKDVNLQLVDRLPDAYTYNLCTLGKKLTDSEYSLLERVMFRHR